MKNMIKKSSVFSASFLFVMIFVMACFSAKVYAGKPVYYDGWSDQYRVTVTWEVLNPHEDAGNYFGVYYYMPGNGGYYKSNTGQYSFVEYETMATDEKGIRTCTFGLQGPPCRIKMSVYGSAMDHTQYYIKKVEVEPIHPRPGTGLPKKFTLRCSRIPLHVICSWIGESRSFQTGMIRLATKKLYLVMIK